MSAPHQHGYKMRMIKALCLFSFLGFLSSGLSTVWAGTPANSQKMPAIIIDWPWIVPSDPDYVYTPGEFAASLEERACSALLQGYKFMYLKWTSPSCK